MGIKGNLLEHYASRTPQSFVQFDGNYVGVDFEDCIMRADGDGDCLTAGVTYELMHGASVRLLIHPDTTRKEALRLLKKLRGWIKKGECFEEMRAPALAQDQPTEDVDCPF